MAQAPESAACANDFPVARNASWMAAFAVVSTERPSIGASQTPASLAAAPPAKPVFPTLGRRSGPHISAAIEGNLSAGSGLRPRSSAVRAQVGTGLPELGCT